MPRKKTINYRLLLKVSHNYYVKGLTQQEISHQIGLSRPMVSRLLKRAEEVGIVKVNIIPQPGIYTEIEDKLEEKYGLRDSIIVEVSEPDSQVSTSREIGSAAAEYFSLVVRDSNMIGISWGTTLRAMVDTLQKHELRNSHIVQLIGGLGKPESEAHATYILRRMVTQINSKLSILNISGIVDSTSVKKAVLLDSHMKEVFNLFSKIDVAFVGIGAPTPDSVVMRDGTILSEEELEMLLAKGALGDICLRFFDKSGNIIHSEIDDRVVGISLEELKRIDRVVGVAGGPHKVKVIRAALLGKLVNVLVTDHVSAKKILQDQ